MILHFHRYFKALCLRSAQLRLVREETACLVEIHTRITPRDFFFPIRLEDLWPRLQSVSLCGQEVTALGGEDLLLVLCAHGAKEMWRRLG
jgi:hypothetical protein